MLFRIDYEHFLTHFIDYFTRNEILSFKYLIISAAIINTNKMENVSKCAWLYPSSEVIENYTFYKDDEIFKKEFYDELKSTSHMVNQYIVEPLVEKYNLILICRKQENTIIDTLVHYLKEEYCIDCIDLNKLFSTGSIGEISYDFDKIKEAFNKSHDENMKEHDKELAKSEAGRASLLMRMPLKERVKKLKELGYNPDKIPKEEIEQILINDWVKDSN